jgi:uncharacterized HhH-GPD family protein
MTKIPITGNDDADRLLEENPLALLLGMLLDQQVPMEWAFFGPYLLTERMGGTLDARAIASMPEDDFLVIAKGPRAIHRFPGSMGKRVQAVCQVIVAEYDGDASRIWTEAKDGADLRKRLEALPGFGPEKSRIFIALLAKRMDVRPDGWQEASAPFGDDVPRSVADIESAETLALVREWKQARKKEGKNKSDA